MLLLADSGSSKTDWIFFDRNSQELHRTRTIGLNPTVLQKDVIKEAIGSNEDLMKRKGEVDEILFFGASCGTISSQLTIQEILKCFFTTDNVIVREDLVAAVLSASEVPSIVAILGTGSNCCYYDGHTIEKRIPTVGYFLTDDGSGNHMGRELLKDYYYNKLPEELKFSFEKDFKLDVDYMTQQLYYENAPNRFLAQHARFLIENMEHPHAQAILKRVLRKFIDNHLIQYEDKLIEQVNVCFIGSIAFHCRSLITSMIKNRGYNVSVTFVRRPVENLIDQLRDGKLLHVEGVS